ncbi:methyltransferase domain-containing protein [Granulosicoccus sp. 3-233]|uniref:methyltransferase domain-containing protein n=1 Tax=Granulosicoccus sp. 3-233 TaxID=3417969 RepID=UPI003D34A89A
MLQTENAMQVDPATDSAVARNSISNSAPRARTRPVVRSSYLVERLFATPENNLFNYVKFHLVNDHIKACKLDDARLMDIGCGLQVARRFIEALNPDVRYYGIDYEASFAPDAVVDLNVKGALRKPMQWKPDVVMLLDVLEHLHEDESDLSQVIRHVAESMSGDARLIITVPQWYRLDRFKLAHLHYPEHKIRLTQGEWKRLIEEHFDIQTIQGVGFLSVIPYLPMAFKRYTPDNALGRLFTHMRSKTFEKRWIKPLDLFLSRTLGRIGPFKHLSNDILIVATPRNRA